VIGLILHDRYAASERMVTAKSPSRYKGCDRLETKGLADSLRPIRPS
jgi:hypothetical protein